MSGITDYQMLRLFQELYDVHGAAAIDHDDVLYLTLCTGIVITWKISMMHFINILIMVPS